VRALFAVPRTALELLPQYARIAAVVGEAFKDVGAQLCAELGSEFRWLQRKKSQHNLETKVRNIKFIGELVKFRVAPPHLAFTCLKTCVDDFSHHAVDVACALLEVAGGFLLRSPPTATRTAAFLEIIMRLKKAKPLNARDASLVDNASRLSPASSQRSFWSFERRGLLEVAPRSRERTNAGEF
jgi:regulator of nonsense transcripts 2